jgi:mxaJ protein
MVSPSVGLGALLSLALLAAPLPAEAGGWELKVCADPDNLPFSNRAGEGIDNKIAAILAEDLNADLTYVWLPDLRSRTRQRFVQGGECDMVLGLIDGQPGFLTSYAYYRTGYVFLYPEGARFEVNSLDDAVLKDLRIGLPGGAAKLPPPGLSLANRGIIANQFHFIDRRDPDKAYPPMLEALGRREIDLAIAWGPVAGAYAKQKGGFVVRPVTPEIDQPFIPMVASLTIGVRPQDEGLRDDIDLALSRTWDKTRSVLEAAGVPLIDLPPPSPSLNGGG